MSAPQDPVVDPDQVPEEMPGEDPGVPPETEPDPEAPVEVQPGDVAEDPTDASAEPQVDPPSAS